MKYTTPEINTRFDLLYKYERRCVIYFLQEVGHADLTDIVYVLTKQDPISNDPDRIEISLRHTHLPKLASTGVLEFDSRSDTVQYSGDELIENVLDITPDTHVPVNV